ncbi:MAG: hypothetical protein M3Z16_08780 [Pseudomonadota bacterium]|nr:hypothetical protein [Pseudomonadota bacterium]
MVALLVVWMASVALSVAGTAQLHGWWFSSLLAVLFAGVALAAWARWQREHIIRESALPQFLKRKLRETYPTLDGRDCDLVERGLRQFFMACLRSDRRFVAMPSKVVDAFWHEFILHTKAYASWCDLVLGRFLHHTPAEALGARASDNDALRRAWFWACREESINPRRPTRLPLLFALDAKLNIEGGYRYVTDCSGMPGRVGAMAPGPAAAAVYCATGFGDASISGDAATMGGSEPRAGNGNGDGGDVGFGSDGGGCSGGDGGGCGGGGD